LFSVKTAYRTLIICLKKRRRKNVANLQKYITAWFREKYRRKCALRGVKENIVLPLVPCKT